MQEILKRRKPRKPERTNPWDISRFPLKKPLEIQGLASFVDAGAIKRLSKPRSALATTAPALRRRTRK